MGPAGVRVASAASLIEVSRREMTDVWGTHAGVLWASLAKA